MFQATTNKSNRQVTKKVMMEMRAGRCGCTSKICLPQSSKGCESLPEVARVEMVVTSQMSQPIHPNHRGEAKAGKAAGAVRLQFVHWIILMLILGKVHVYYGSTPNRILRQFIGLKKQPWQTQVQIATKALTNPHPEESVFAAVPIASTLETLQLYRQYANGLNALSDQLSSLPNLSDNPSNPEPTKETLATSQACLVAIQPFFTSKPQTPQHVEKADVEGINLLATEIQNWKQSGGGIETEESLRFRIKDLISALEVNVGNQTSTLFSSLQSLGIELDSLVQSWETLCQTQMCAVEGGMCFALSCDGYSSL